MPSRRDQQGEPDKPASIAMLSSSRVMLKFPSMFMVIVSAPLPVTTTEPSARGAAPVDAPGSRSCSAVQRLWDNLRLVFGDIAKLTRIVRR